jgi:hypothetical protein
VRVFLAGALCGAVLVAVVGAAPVWWKHRSNSDPIVDDWVPDWANWMPAYDACLANTGSKVRCDAMIRIIKRESQAASTASAARVPKVPRD